MKTRILLVTNSLGSGGTEKIFDWLMRSLPVDQFEIRCVLKNGTETQYIADHHSKIINVRGGSFSCFKIIRAEVKYFLPHIVISGLFPMNLIVPFIKVGLAKEKQPVLLLRESTIQSQYYKITSLKRKLGIMQLYNTYQYYDGVICQSQDMAKEVKEKSNYKAKTYLVPNPVIGLRNKARINEPDILRIVTVGNLRKEKGYDRLILIIKLLLSKYSGQLQYHIIGTGKHEQFEELSFLIAQEKLEEVITLHGHQAQPLDIVSCCDVFIQGSYVEGFPNTLLEALSVGIPTIAYDVPGGSKEIIQDGQNGYLVEDGDAEKFVKRILQFQSLRMNRQQRIDDVFDRFSEEVIKKKYMQIIAQVIGGR